MPDTLSSSWLSLPDPDRDRPALASPLTHPAEVVERWRVRLPEPMRLEGLGGEIDRPWYRVEETWRLDEASTLLEVEQRYVGRTDRVAADDRDDFEAPADEMDGLLRFSIEDARPRPAWLRSVVDGLDGLAEHEPAEPTRLARVEAWVLLAAGPCIVGWGAFRHRRGRKRAGVRQGRAHRMG